DQLKLLKSIRIRRDTSPSIRQGPRRPCAGLGHAVLGKRLIFPPYDRHFPPLRHHPRRLSAVRSRWMRLLFDDCVLDPERRELSRGGAPVHLEPQVFDLLLHLIRNRDHVVSKDELLAAVWRGRIVSE